MFKSSAVSHDFWSLPGHQPQTYDSYGQERQPDGHHSHDGHGSAYDDRGLAWVETWASQWVQDHGWVPRQIWDWIQKHDHHDVQYGHGHHWCPDDDTPVPGDTSHDLNDYEARSADGTGNNADHGQWGATGATFVRLSHAHYEDGANEPEMRENPRTISNAVMAQDGDMPNSFGASDLFTFFGQFLDHDIDLTKEGKGEEMNTYAPAGDPVFAEGNAFTIERSAPLEGDGVREHGNAITSFLDASNIYGSSEELTALLRTDGGKGAYLLTGEGDSLPTLGQLKAEHGDLGIADDDLVAGGARDNFFVAGDVRANENVALISMHTVWMREHNHQVDRLKQDHPDWSGEELFNSARIIVEAEYQNVVYSEYLPLLLGAENIPEYGGYDLTVNASIAHEFATAAYRLGHSQLSSTLHRTEEDGSTVAEGDLGLFKAFFSPSVLAEGGGVDPLVRGLAGNHGQEIDTAIVDDVRNLLFGDGGVGTDLAVLNIMRGRDHGIPPLNDVREDMGLGRHTDFSDLTSDPQVAAKLASVYDSVDTVDLWVGGLAEDKYSGSQLGDTFHTIVLDQFMRLRDGDSFYYEKRLADDPDLLAAIENTSFSDILQRNTDVDYLQEDVFLAHERIGGSEHGEWLDGTDGRDLMIGFEGNDFLVAGKGDDTLHGGKGDDEMVGGEGSDLFVFAKGSGSDHVYQFDARYDRIDVSDYGFADVHEVLERAIQKDWSTTLVLDEAAGDQVKLVGVKQSWLTAETFVFDDDAIV